MPDVPFSDALGQLLADYADTDLDELISELELQAQALREEAETKDG
jgi:hypothetical protein